MFSRVRNPRGRSSNGPPGFIRPCRPILAHHLPDGPGWVHELKHDGYRLQIHVRDGRARLYTMNGANWSDRYLRIIEAAAKIKGHAVLDAEAVCLDVAGTEGDPETKVRLAAFRQGLEKRGWFEGRNVRIEIIFAGGNVNQYGQFAKELVATQPDVILAQTTQVAAALQHENSVIPTVFASVSDPIGSGLAASLARPGGNFTGVLQYEGDGATS